LRGRFLTTRLSRVRIFLVGDEGPEILDIQHRLVALGWAIAPAELHGRYGPSTEEAVRAFQRRRSLPADGRVGPDTWGQLVEASFRYGDRTLYLHAPYLRGDDVRELQRKLNALGFDAGREDGVLGPLTELAIREFQRNVGDAVDGVVGLHTIATLDRMRPLETARSRAFVRESEQLRQGRPGLEGQVIAIDAGPPPEVPSGADPRRVGMVSADASVLHVLMANAVAEELAGLGAKPELLRLEAPDPAPSERARIANELGAALCVSIQVGTSSVIAGPSCAYFGTDVTHSPTGRHLGELILEELERGFGRIGRLERLTVAMLRETRMPAVQVEPLSLGNEADRSIAADPAVPARVGNAVAAGIRRFFHGP
jgi:N-acetylmuramoyl-L-alanine amidase